MKNAENLSKPGAGRRSFIWKAGAAVSAALVTAAPGVAGRKRDGAVSGAPDDAARLAERLAALEDERAIRALHSRYETLLDSGRYEDLPALFAADATVEFGGEVFRGGQGLASLYGERFRAGQSGRKLGPAPGFAIDAARYPESVTIASGRTAATASFHYSLQVGTPMDDSWQLVQMARLQGGGIQRWCEGGVYEVSYVKDARGDWKIASLKHQCLSRTDYRPGRTGAEPVQLV